MAQVTRICGDALVTHICEDAGEAFPGSSERAPGSPLGTPSSRRAHASSRDVTLWDAIHFEIFAEGQGHSGQHPEWPPRAAPQVTHIYGDALPGPIYAWTPAQGGAPRDTYMRGRAPKVVHQVSRICGDVPILACRDLDKALHRPSLLPCVLAA